MTPAATASRLEQRRTLPRGRAERFTGYGALAVPFESGHLLAFRRFASSSIGPPYTSVWRRDPDGSWTFYIDVEPMRGCPRYFGPALARVQRADIEVEWIGSHGVAVHVLGADLHWTLRLQTTPLTSALGVISRSLPDPLWHRMSGAAGTAGGALLRTGSLRLQGRSPAGHRFLFHPTRIWQVAASTAQLGALDLGTDVVAPDTARLGDFLLPRRGLFAAGSAVFEPQP